MSGTRLIAVGRVAGAFGVKGEVRIAPYGEDPMALVRYGALKGKDGAVVLTLFGGRAHKGALVARTREVQSKEAADALRGVELFVARDQFAPPEDEDEFYLADLIGMRCVLGSGEVLGTVKAVPNFGAGDLLEITLAAGGTTLLPFTREVAPEVRVKDGVIVVAPPGEI